MHLKKKSPLPILFLNNLYISSCTFGGGFVIAGLMKKKYVDGLHWISEEEMIDYIALAQSSPGAIAVNTAILIGWHADGFAGMLVSVFGTILPPMIILSLVSVFYDILLSFQAVSLLLKGMQAGVAAVLLDVILTLGKNSIKKDKWFAAVLMFISLLALLLFDVNEVFIIGAALLIGALRFITKMYCWKGDTK